MFPEAYHTAMLTTELECSYIKKARKNVQFSNMERQLLILSDETM